MTVPTVAPSRPAVSVVIPTFNRASLIGQAVESVLGQTLADVELIIVDDGSTDDTEAVVRRYGDRVTFIRTENRRAGHARNVGMQRARGRYLTFLDSDDLLYPYALELQAQILDHHPEAGFVCAEVSGFDDHGFFERCHLKQYHNASFCNPSLTYDRIYASSAPLSTYGAVPTALLKDDPGAAARRVYHGNIFDRYLCDFVLCQNTGMIRHSLVASVGVRNERVRFYEELDYLLRFSRQHHVCFVDVPTYKLRYHDGQVSTTARRDGKYVWMRKQQELLRVITRNAQADSEVYAVHRARFDRQLGRLHRAAAVPALLVSSHASGARRRKVLARGYLRRARRQYGTPAAALICASYLPATARRVAVTAIEKVRRWRTTGVRTYSASLVRAFLTQRTVMALKSGARDLRWLAQGLTVRTPPLPARVESVLFVCVGNICRSPFAERLAAARYPGLRYASAGIRANQAAAPPPEAVDAALARRVSLDGHRPQLLTGDLVAAHDLIVVMEANQLTQLRATYPDAVERLVLLPLFDPQAGRGYERSHIPDPFQHSRDVYDRCYARIDRAVSNLLRSTAGISALAKSD